MSDVSGGEDLTEDIIRAHFQLILGRDPSDGEVRNWMASGIPRDRLREAFLRSSEFARSFRNLPGSTEWSPPNGQILINIHIPKTAGTTLVSILKGFYFEEEIIVVHTETLDDLHRMAAADRGKLKVVSGHLVHGLANQFHKKCLYTCVLRSPIDRLFSFYRFLRRSTGHHLNALVLETCQNFGAFVTLACSRPDLRYEVDNGQCRRLAGGFAGSIDAPMEDVFRQSVNHLTADNMIFGVTESFDSYLKILQAHGIIPYTLDMRENTAPDNGTGLLSELKAMNDEEASLLNAFTYWDMRLYDVALTCLAQSPQAQEAYP